MRKGGKVKGMNEKIIEDVNDAIPIFSLNAFSFIETKPNVIMWGIE